MLVGVPREIKTGEARVALTPAGAAELVAHGHDVVIEAVASLPGVALLIAGEGSERPRLEVLIARLGVAALAAVAAGLAAGDAR